MPPEALEENPHYNSTIDMFSFGQLLLYTVVQEFPEPTAATCMDPNNRGVIMARTEAERRARYIEQLHEGHPLIRLVRECLENDPSRRPSANQVLSQLEQLKNRIEDPYEHMTKIDMMGALREKDAALREKDIVLRERDSAIAELEERVGIKDAEIQRLNPERIHHMEVSMLPLTYNCLTIVSYSMACTKHILACMRQTIKVCIGLKVICKKNPSA